MSLDFEQSLSEWVDLGSSVASLNGLAAATICCWCNPESTSSNRATCAFSTGSGSVTDSRASQKQISGGWLSSSRRLDGGSFDVESGGSLVTGAWQHVACIMNWAGSFHAVYYDGALVTSDTPAAWTGNCSATNSQASAIGAEDDGSGAYFDGLIEDVRVYSRALSAAEIETIVAARGHDSLIDGLVDRWMLSEGAPGVSASGAGSVVDKMLGAVTGTPTNTPTYAESWVSPRRRRAR